MYHCYRTGQSLHLFPWICKRECFEWGSGVRLGWKRSEDSAKFSLLRLAVAGSQLRVTTEPIQHTVAVLLAFRHRCGRMCIYLHICNDAVYEKYTNAFCTWTNPFPFFFYFSLAHSPTLSTDSLTKDCNLPRVETPAIRHRMMDLRQLTCQSTSPNFNHHQLE